jgi:hypothetical protein
MRCPHCGRADVPEGAKFCIDCGAALPRRSSDGAVARPRVSKSSLIIDYDDVVPQRRRPRARVAALAGLGIVVVGVGAWLTLSSLGASQPAEVPALPPRAAPSPAPLDSISAPAPAAPAPTPVVHPAPARERTAPGLLSLNAVPWGTVSIDGRAVGNTPLLDVRLAPGAHRVRVERLGYEPYERVVSVVAGQRLRITDISLVPQRP